MQAIFDKLFQLIKFSASERTCAAQVRITLLPCAKHIYFVALEHFRITVLTESDESHPGPAEWEKVLVVESVQGEARFIAVDISL